MPACFRRKGSAPIVRLPRSRLAPPRSSESCGHFGDTPGWIDHAEGQARHATAMGCLENATLSACGATGCADQSGINRGVAARARKGRPAATARRSGPLPEEKRRLSVIKTTEFWLIARTTCVLTKRIRDTREDRVAFSRHRVDIIDQKSGSIDRSTDTFN